MNNHPDDAYRRLKADQESLLPGLAYVGAAVIGGSVLVNRVRSMPVKVLTPLAVAAVTGAYFLPAHTDLIKNTWMPMRVSRNIDSTSTSNSMRDLKKSAEGAAFDLSHKTVETMDDVQRQAKASWSDIKPKVENLAETYREAGQDQVNNIVNKSVYETKSWLDQQKAEADRILNETASILSSSTPSSRQEHHNKFHDFDLPSTKMSQAAKEKAYFKETAVPEQPSASRWSWWKSSDTTSPKMETKVSDTTSPKMEAKVSEKPSASTASTTVQSSKPRKVIVDKAVAHAAVKGHDDIVYRNALLGKNAEETAHKVHENVVDAALPKHRQGRHEKHPMEISRQAAESNYKDGQFIVRISPDDADALPQRVRRGSVKKDIHHGLQNLEKRAHMLYDGVEHLEHSINKRVQKSLQEEADFWHQQSLKEEANVRGGERGM